MDDENKEGDRSKEAPADKKDEAIPKARLDAEVARRHKAEEELSTLKKTQEESAKAALVEQNKFKELYEGVAPKAKLVDEMEVSMTEYFAAETAELSDAHKGLIPDGPLHKKLAWVKKAKAAGVFGEQKSPDNTFNGKPKNKLPAEKWYLEIKSDDSRFTSLTDSQYIEWKRHNGKVPTVLRGGF